MDSEDGRRRTIAACDDVLSQCQRNHQRECCPPQLFTSVLLGILACVLVTGGVFLAFHKWDHTWLLVSAVGVILMAIGTALHCCSSDGDHRKNVRCKGGCNAVRSKPDVMSNGGAMLTEQLLPLSNARSVSQLSLNMLPGYFPPLVYPAGSPYSLEQHAAVVQNISKLVQHHQQLHLQSPTTTQPDSKSFILLPLPVDTNAANIQNIVAAVCQLDSNTAQDAGTDIQNVDAVSEATRIQMIQESPISTGDQLQTTAPRNQSILPIFKHVEVQTCCDWRQQQRDNASSNCSPTTAALPPEQQSVTVEEILLLDDSSEFVELELGRTEDVAVSAILVPVESISLQCSADQFVSTRNSTTSTVCDIPVAVQQEISNEINDIYDVPALLQSVSDTVQTQDTEDDEIPLQNNRLPILTENTADNCGTVVIETITLENVVEDNVILSVSPTNAIIPDTTVECAIARDEPAPHDYLEGDVSLTNINSQVGSTADTSDLESELLERSSPPPSYDDVTQEASHLPFNNFAAAYGTL